MSHICLLTNVAFLSQIASSAPLLCSRTYVFGQSAYRHIFKVLTTNESKLLASLGPKSFYAMQYNTADFWSSCCVVLFLQTMENPKASFHAIRHDDRVNNAIFYFEQGVYIYKLKAFCGHLQSNVHQIYVPGARCLYIANFHGAPILHFERSILHRKEHRTLLRNDNLLNILLLSYIPQDYKVNLPTT